ncbi:MAG: HAD family hydrolase [Candidatus Heimdallarchaeota archaeon]|nr:HAD family hydrolase [Candidatus Heimdallarchaeota archaeon]
MNEQSSWNEYALLFDMDGVIISLKARWIDPLEEVISSINSNYDRKAIEEKSSSLILVHGGKTNALMLKGIIQVCSVCGLSRFQTFRVVFRLVFMFISRTKFRIVPLEGVTDTLKFLKDQGFKLALVTSASRITTRALKKSYPEIYNKFDCIYTRNDVKLTKPSPDQLLLALKKLDVDKAKTAMIGDFISDIIAGKEAGVKTIAVLSEYPEVNRFPLESAEPDIIINNITEIPNIILQIFQPSF